MTYSGFSQKSSFVQIIAHSKNEHHTCKTNAFSKEHGPEKGNSLYFSRFAYHVECCNTAVVVCQLPVSNACSSVKYRRICIVTTSEHALYVTLQILQKHKQETVNTLQAVS